jgi:hypothetical protein
MLQLQQLPAVSCNLRAAAPSLVLLPPCCSAPRGPLLFNPRLCRSQDQLAGPQLRQLVPNHTRRQLCHDQRRAASLRLLLPPCCSAPPLSNLKVDVGVAAQRNILAASSRPSVGCHVVDLVRRSACTKIAAACRGFRHGCPSLCCLYQTCALLCAVCIRHVPCCVPRSVCTNKPRSARGMIWFFCHAVHPGQQHCLQCTQVYYTQAVYPGVLKHTGRIPHIRIWQCCRPSFPFLHRSLVRTGTCRYMHAHVGVGLQASCAPGEPSFRAERMNERSTVQLQLTTAEVKGVWVWVPPQKGVWVWV